MAYKTDKEVEVYWAERVNPNPSEKTIQSDANFLNKSLTGVSTAIEFGIGTGRTLDFYPMGTKIYGHDISDTYKDRALDKALVVGVELIIGKHEVGYDFSDIETDTFDVAVASKSLMHVRPENIKKVVTALLRIAKKVVIINYFDVTGEVKMAEHNFSHDLRSILNELGAHFDSSEINEEKNVQIVAHLPKEITEEPIQKLEEQAKPKKKKRRRKNASSES